MQYLVPDNLNAATAASNVCNDKDTSLRESDSPIQEAASLPIPQFTWIRTTSDETDGSIDVPGGTNAPASTATNLEYYTLPRLMKRATKNEST